jgi:hypothetical protein
MLESCRKRAIISLSPGLLSANAECALCVGRGRHGCNSHKATHPEDSSPAHPIHSFLACHACSKRGGVQAELFCFLCEGGKLVILVSV